jgi:hypothetical protein
MAKKTSGFLSKMSTAKEAFEKHKGDEVKYDTGGELPAGVEGVAQLVECKFSQYEKGDKKGEYFFYAAGVVVEPKEHDGLKIQGRRTSIMEPLCETPTRSRKSVDDHLQWILNQLKLLGAPVAEISFEDLEPTVVMLKEAKPYFKFRTWKGTKQKPTDPEPMVNHVWNGIVEYEHEESADDGVEDNTEEVAEPKKENKKEASKKEETKTVETVTDEEWNELATLADEMDEEAQTNIEAKAKGLGIDVDNYDSWGSVVEAIKEKLAVSDSEDDSGTEAEIEVGDLCHYKPISLKTKKPGKAVACEVVSVNESGTYDLKNVDNEKIIYKDVSPDDMIFNE